MKIDIDIREKVTITEVYDGITIKTAEGKKLRVCLRDYGFDMRIDDGQWFHVDNQEDLCCVKCNRKNKLKKLDNET